MRKVNKITNALLDEELMLLVFTEFISTGSVKIGFDSKSVIVGRMITRPSGCSWDRFFKRKAWKKPYAKIHHKKNSITITLDDK